MKINTSQIHIRQLPYFTVHCLVGIVLLLSSTVASALPAKFSKENVITGLTSPVNIVTLPDGKMLIAEKAGKVKRFDPSVGQSSLTTVLSIPNVHTASERGLASLALDPNFSSNGFFYAYYSQIGNDNRNRISRFKLNATTANGELLVWEDNSPYKSCCHYGGGMDFGPDNMLYLTTGEEFDGPQAQDLTEAGGKIIRLDTSKLSSVGGWTRGGTNAHIIPRDNPFYDGTGPNLDEIWARGLRNPFRAHWDIPGNRFFIGEVGGNITATAREDLHLGQAGANYGWPFCEGQCTNPAYSDPIYDYGHTDATPNGGAITAGVVYRGSQFPTEYNGTFFVADYVIGNIKYLELNANGSVISVNDFATNAGSIVALEEGPDGALYGVDYGGEKIIRIVYEDGNQAPAITRATANVVSGVNPLKVTFTGDATDVENNRLTYEWNFGDGSNSANGKTVQHTYRQNGIFDAYLEVSDGSRVTKSTEIIIQVGAAPVINITSPIDGSLFRAGDSINFAARVSNSVAPPYTYEWDIDFFHNSHTHPSLDYTGASSSFQINRTGHDYHDDTGYRFELTVTDRNGLKSTKTVEIVPDKVNIDLATSPAGLNVFVDGLTIPTPISYDTIIGFEHLLSVAETICENGISYRFSGWSNGGDRSHLINVPATDTNLTANYGIDGVCNDIPGTGLVMHLESDQGVVTNGENVTRWNDQSASGNDLSSLADGPIVEANALKGNPVIEFDGVDDTLERNGAFTGFPEGARDRTMFVVANYDSGGYGGVAFGTAAVNQTFGLIVTPAGNLAIQGWGTSNDFPSTTPATGQGWLIQSAKVSQNQMTHYVNGETIETHAHTYDTNVEKFIVGAEIDDSPHVDMQIAAIIVYNRSLSDDEFQQVEAYLEAKYFGSINDSPTTITTPVAGTTLTAESQMITWKSNSTSVSNYLLTAGSTPMGMEYFSSGSLPVTTTSTLVTGLPTDGSNVYITLRYRESGNWRTVEQIHQTASTTIPAPEVTSPETGETLAGLTHVMSWKPTGTTLDNYWAYAGSTPGSSDYYNSGSLSRDTTSVVLTGLPVDGSDVHITLWYKQNGIWKSVAQVNPARSSSASPPAFTSPVEASTLTDDTQLIEWHSNDADVSDYWIYAGTPTDTTAYYSSGNLTASTTSQTLTGLPVDGSEITFTLWYKIDGQWFSQEQLNTATLATTSFTIPVTGLVAQFESSEGVSLRGGVIDAWQDQSGRENHLTGTGNTSLIVDALNGYPIIDFDGTDAKLERTSDLSGLPDGSADRTIMLAVNYRGNGDGGVTYGSEQSNQTFGLITTSTGELAVQGWGAANDFASGSAGTGEGWLVQTVVLEDDQLTHYRNSTQIDAETHRFNTVIDRLVLGVDFDSAPFVDMQVAALFVYDRAIDSAERTELLSYLQTKYDIGSGGGGGNVPPVANNDSATVVSGSSELIDVLANDTDVDGVSTVRPDSISITRQPAHGTVTANTDGSVTYTHNGTSGSIDNFSYTINDDQDAISNVASVNVTISDGPVGIPEITSRSTDSSLPATTRTLTWESNGAPVSDYWVYAGTGAQEDNYYNSGQLQSGTSTHTLTGLPVDGSAVTITLWYRISEQWHSIVQKLPATIAAVPAIASPISGADLTGATATFTWDPNGVAVNEWWLFVGQSPDSAEHFNSGNLGDVSGVDVTLPADGSLVYVTLWYRASGNIWRSIVESYTSYP